MGLDQGWYLKPTKEEQAEALLKGVEAQDTEIQYFRKWHPLQSFFWDYYPDSLSDPNGEDLEMTESILNDLEVWLDSDEIYDSDNDWRKEDFDENRKIVRDKTLPTLRKYLDQGRTVVYNGDW